MSVGSIASPDFIAVGWRLNGHFWVMASDSLKHASVEADYDDPEEHLYGPIIMSWEPQRLRKVTVEAELKANERGEFYAFARGETYEIALERALKLNAEALRADPTV